MSFILDILFGCWHKNLSFPISARDGKRVPMYQTCLDCGKELPYDWQAMKIRRAA